ncbi:hypothetical protein U0070_010000, partial [Myodes glareolus]
MEQYAGGCVAGNVESQDAESLGIGSHFCGHALLIEGPKLAFIVHFNEFLAAVPNIYIGLYDKYGYADIMVRGKRIHIMMSGMPGGGKKELATLQAPSGDRTTRSPIYTAFLQHLPSPHSQMQFQTDDVSQYAGIVAKFIVAGPARVEGYFTPHQPFIINISGEEIRKRNGGGSSEVAPVANAAVTVILVIAAMVSLTKAAAEAEAAAAAEAEAAAAGHLKNFNIHENPKETLEDHFKILCYGMGHVLLNQLISLPSDVFLPLPSTD